MKFSLEQGIAAAVAAVVVGALVVFAVDAGPAIGAGMAPARASEESRALPAPTGVAAFKDERTQASVVFAGGCFWGVQGVFQHVDGVVSATSGYAGGSRAQATYDAVSTGRTGHAEAVKVDYDPVKVSYGQLMQILFSVVHDPTQLNRQGPDTGTQYRSAIFPTTNAQASAAKAYIGQLDAARVFDAAIVTKIEPGQSFYPAEAYHQDFLTKNPDYPYIVINDLPKVAAMQSFFPEEYRETPVLVGNRDLAR